MSQGETKVRQSKTRGSKGFTYDVDRKQVR